MSTSEQVDTAESVPQPAPTLGGAEVAASTPQPTESNTADAVPEATSTTSAEVTGKEEQEKSVTAAVQEAEAEAQDDSKQGEQDSESAVTASQAEAVTEKGTAESLGARPASEAPITSQEDVSQEVSKASPSSQSSEAEAASSDPSHASAEVPVSKEGEAEAAKDPVTSDPLGVSQQEEQSESHAHTTPAVPDSPAPSLPSKPATPRVDRLTAPTRQGSLPPPPPPEKPTPEEVAKIAHAFGKELSPAATPSPRRSTDKALPPTADELASAVASSSSSSTAPTANAGPGLSSSSASPQIPQSASGGLRVGKGPPPPANPPEELPFDFNRFLEQMRHRSAVPVGEYVRSFIRGFSKKPYRTADQIRLIFDFLAFITEKMREAEVWANSTTAEFDNATEAMEKLIMNRLYSLTFTPAVAREGKWAVQTDDLERDRIIKDRILLFSWIRPEHLDIPVGEHTAGFVEFAAQELLKMNNYKAPRDKLICILNCCKVIFGMIRHMATSESADSFVPALIYVVLKANPDNLVSNVEYISRFRSPERLSSESGYYLSSLAGAISFIESMDHTSLTNVTQEEMERNVDAAVTALALAAPADPPAQGRSGVSLSGSNSPFAEEGARTLQSLAPIAASLADDTRMFLQRTGEAARAGLAGGLGRPMGALGNLFKEQLDGMRTPSPATGASSPSNEPRPSMERSPR